VKAVRRSIDALAYGLAAMAGAAMALIVLLITLEIVGRGMFSHSFRFTWEIVSYCLGILIFGGLGWTLRTGGHIRVTALAKTLPARWVRCLETVAHALSAALASLLAFALIQLCIASFIDQSRSFLATETLLWIPQAFMALGAVGFALAAWLRLLLHLAGLPGDVDPLHVQSTQAHA